MNPKDETRRRGAVLVVTLIALALLVGLVFFVFNLGDQVNNRLVLQNAADAAAVSGGGFQARSLNVIAMNNVGQAKMIALAMVIDAVPLAAELAIIELQQDLAGRDSLPKGLGEQLARGVPETRTEQAYPTSASYAAVVADAILLMPQLPETDVDSGITYDRGLFGLLWPGMGDADDPDGYAAVQQRIAQHGTIVDNGSAGFSRSNERGARWSESDAVNEYRGTSLETLDTEATATFQARLTPEQATQHLYAWWSADRDGVHRSSAARYDITHVGGTQTVTADQNRSSGTWVYLGQFTFPIVENRAEVRVVLHGPEPLGDRDQELTNFLRNGLEKLHREMTPDDEQTLTDYEELLAVDEALNSADETVPEDGAYDVAESTYWDAPGGGRGKLWQSAMAMREFSRATAEAVGPLAQANASRFGQASGAATAFALPAEAAIPYREGSFEDFGPVLTGRFRVRYVEPTGASLEMPIHEEVRRINDLDLSLDDCASMFEQHTMMGEQLTGLREELEGSTDWEEVSRRIDAMQAQTGRIDELQAAIGERLDVSERLGSLHSRLEDIERQLRRMEEQVAEEKNPLPLRPMLDALERLRSDPENNAGLDERIFTEEDAERQEKEDRLANLHNTCPGGGIGDYAFPQRLGPYAKLHRWRHEWYAWTPTSGPGWGGDPEVGASRPHERSDLLGYTTYGPYRWALDEVTREFGLVGSHTGELETTRFAYYVRLAANIKLGYVYGVERPQQVRYVTRWITDYEEARQFAESLDNRRLILRTRYYRPVVVSSVAPDHPNWLKDRATYYCSAGNESISWRGDGISPPSDPPAALWVWEPRGFWDVRTHRPGATKLNDYTWRWLREYDVLHESRVNLNERLSAEDGAAIPWKLHIASWYVFGGIQVAEAVTVANPCNWPDDETDLPAPLLMDTARGDYTDDHDAGIRRSDFTFLGIASYASPAKVWSGRFSHGNPSGAVTTVAQAEVFNNLSWDLWTQHWDAQLVPVTGWEDWMDRLSTDAETAANVHNELDPQQLRDIQEYLDAIPPELAEIFMNH